MTGGRAASGAVGWDGHVMAIAAFVAAPLTIFAPLGMAPLFAIAAILVLAADMARGRGLPRGLLAIFLASPMLRRFALLAGLLCLWALASSAWAVSAKLAIDNLSQILPMFCGALILFAAALRLDGAARKRVHGALLTGVAVAFLIYLEERFFNAPIGHLLHSFVDEQRELVYSPYNRGLSIFTLLTFAAILIIRRKPGFFASRLVNRALSVALLAGLLALLAIYYGSSVEIAVFAGTGAFALGLILPKLAPWIIGGLLALYVAVVPTLPPLIVPHIDLLALTAKTGNVSIAHRLVIWQFAAERIADKPLSGWGMNSARVIPGGKDKVTLSMTADGHILSQGERMPLHSHNAALQWWLELGAPGAILAASIWLLGLVAIARHMRGHVSRAAAGALLVAGFGVANLSYGAWQAWWISGLLFAAVLTTLFDIPEAAPARASDT